MNIAEKSKAQVDMLNYNTRAKAVLHGTGREAGTGKLPRFGRNLTGPYHVEAGLRPAIQADCFVESVTLNSSVSDCLPYDNTHSG